MLPSVGLMARLCSLLLPEQVRDNGVASRATSTARRWIHRAWRWPTRCETLRIGDLVDRCSPTAGGCAPTRPRPRSRCASSTTTSMPCTARSSCTWRRCPRRPPAHDSRRWAEIIELAVNLEHAGDLIEADGRQAGQPQARRHHFSSDGLAELTTLHGLLAGNLRLGLNVFLNGNRDNARRLLEAALPPGGTPPPMPMSTAWPSRWCRASRPAPCTWS